jgi:hypothetical protein
MARKPSFSTRPYNSMLVPRGDRYTLVEACVEISAAAPFGIGALPSRFV